MKKLVVLFFIPIIIGTLFTACNDGDFDVPSFDFDGKAISTCPNTTNLFLYKINDNEALILDTSINNDDNIFFKTARENETFDLNQRITYRIFDVNVTSNYFCQDVPPSNPTIANEWFGDGTLVVTNVITDNGNNTSKYTTTFTVNNLNLVSSGDNIVFETYDFEVLIGTFDN